MRPETKIYERRAIDVIDTDRVAALIIDQLTLQRLFALLKNTDRFSLGDLFAPIGKVPAGNLAHTLLNHRQIGFGQSSWGDHVVEESVSRIVQQRGANTKLRARKQIQDRRG